MTQPINVIRRIASVVSGLLIILSAELGMSSIVSTSSAGDLSIPNQQFMLNVIAILFFAAAGLSAGFVASRPDVVPLVWVELVALALVLLSALMAAVETGAADAARNAIVGTVGLAALAMMYWAAQRLRPRSWR